MNTREILTLFQQPAYVNFIIEKHEKKLTDRNLIKGLSGSSAAIAASAMFDKGGFNLLCVLSGQDEAEKFFRDVSGFIEKNKLLYFPSLWYKTPTHIKLMKDHQVQRTEALNLIKKGTAGKMIITWAEALAEKTATDDNLSQNTFTVRQGDELDVDFLLEFLAEYNFERSDFVFEPGTFSLRGGVLDIFSFGHEKPVRIRLNEDKVETLRLFEPENQLSVKDMPSFTIIPDIESCQDETSRVLLTNYLNENSVVWLNNAADLEEKLTHHKEMLLNNELAEDDDEINFSPKETAADAKEVIEAIESFLVVESGINTSARFDEVLETNTVPQPVFNKNFRMLADNLDENSKNYYRNIIFSDSPQQIERMYAIFDDISRNVEFNPIYVPLSEGFIHHDLKIACYSEHQIFSRMHRAIKKQGYSKEQALTIQELTRLQPGDFVTHIDHGIGKFSGLEKIEIQGKKQEAVRLMYKDNDILYVSIHSLHKISRYSGKDGKPPKLHKLGSDAWQKVKSRTKKKVKDIARDLIKLYAARKAQEGIAFPPDNYLQTELEASFFYEDTPDQASSTEAVKKDMEASHPMDRLVCGDVGFGKTEIALRAAFKAVVGGKQVALLVPTTILALQHYKTFSERLQDFPCNVDYISRFKSKKNQTETLKRLEEGKVDIIIGTHRLLGKDIKFYDLGLLIVDEEQKFGVVAKEKIRSFKTTVDTLTLTATPIPRTLQFSLLGARDLSLINTPPPNRQKTETILETFNEDTIKEAIEREVSRGGQVFFVHNKIKDIEQIADYVRQAVPEARVVIAHGQMDSLKLEEIMVNFVEGFYDVLISTAIVESGLDIPNANTIIINQAQNFGLSDLYQLRGRVGRSADQGYCYLLSPPYSTLPDDARKRLKAIAEFTDLGSGFNVAMRDMDIRGAGNLLGGEQSGFINEVGYETYQKLLKDAVEELKEDEFGQLFEGEEKTQPEVEAQIDADLEIMLPDNYVASVDERLALYNELNTINKEEELQRFAQKLEDRFGNLPEQAEQLLDSVRLKWKAESYFIEKLILKGGKMKANFATSEAAENFFQSSKFGKILTFAQQFPQNCSFKHKNNRVVMVVTPVKSVGKGLNFFDKIESMEGEMA